MIMILCVQRANISKTYLAKRRVSKVKEVFPLFAPCVGTLLLPVPAIVFGIFWPVLFSFVYFRLCSHRCTPLDILKINPFSNILLYCQCQDTSVSFAQTAVADAAAHYEAVGQYAGLSAEADHPSAAEMATRMATYQAVARHHYQNNETWQSSQPRYARSTP